MSGAAASSHFVGCLRPFARFGTLVGCTLLDVCGRLRALDIYIYTPVYLYIGALAAAGGIRHGFGSLGVNFVLKTVTSRVPPSGGPARADFCGGSLALLTPCPKSAAVGALSPYFAGSLRRFAPLPRTLPDVWAVCSLWWVSGVHFAGCLRPFARFGDIYIYTPVYPYID